MIQRLARNFLLTEIYKVSRRIVMVIAVTILILLLLSLAILIYRWKMTIKAALRDEQFMTAVALVAVVSCFSLLMLRSGEGVYERYEQDIASAVDASSVKSIITPKALCNRLQTGCSTEWQQRRFSGTGSGESFSAAASLLEADAEHLQTAYLTVAGRLRQKVSATSQIAESIPVNQNSFIKKLQALISPTLREELRLQSLKGLLESDRKDQQQEVKWLEEKFGYTQHEALSHLRFARQHIVSGNWEKGYQSLYAAAEKNSRLYSSYIQSMQQKEKARRTMLLLGWGIPLLACAVLLVQAFVSRFAPLSNCAKRMLYPGFVFFSGIGLCLMADLSINYLPKLRYLFLETWQNLMIANLLLLITVFILSRAVVHRLLDMLFKYNQLGWWLYLLLFAVGICLIFALPNYGASEIIKLLLITFFALFAATRGGYIAERGYHLGFWRQMTDRGWVARNLTVFCFVMAAIITSVLYLRDFGPLLLIVLLTMVLIWVVMGPVPFSMITGGAAVAIVSAFLLREQLRKFSPIAHIFSRFEEMIAPFSAGSGEIGRLAWLRHAAGTLGFGWGEIPYQGYTGALPNTVVTPAQIASDYTSSHLVAQFGYLGGGIFLLALFVWMLLLFYAIDPSARNLAAKSRFIAWFGSLGLLLLLLQYMITLSGNFAVFALTGITTPMVSYGAYSLLLCVLILAVCYSIEDNPAESARGSKAATQTSAVVTRRLTTVEALLLAAPVILFVTVAWREARLDDQQVSSIETAALMRHAVSALKEGAPEDYRSSASFARLAPNEGDKIRLLNSLMKLDSKLEQLLWEGRLKRRYQMDVDLLAQSLETDRSVAGSVHDKALKAVRSLSIGNRIAHLIWREDLYPARQKNMMQVARFDESQLVQQNPWRAAAGALLMAAPGKEATYLRIGSDPEGIKRPSRNQFVPVGEIYERFNLSGLDTVLQQNLIQYLNHEKGKGLVNPDNHVTISGKKIKAGYDVIITINPELQQMAADILKKELQAGDLATATVAVMDTETGRILAAASQGASEHSRRSGLPLILQEIPPASTTKLIFSAALLDNYESVTANNPGLKRYLASLPYNLSHSVTEYFQPLAFEYGLAPLFRDQAAKFGWNMDCAENQVCTGGILDYLYGSGQSPAGRAYPLGGRIFVKETGKGNQFNLLNNSDLTGLPAYAIFEQALSSGRKPEEISQNIYDSGKYLKIAIAGQGNSRSSAWGELLLVSHIAAAADGKTGFPMPHLVQGVMNSKGELQPIPATATIKPGISPKTGIDLASYLTQVNFSGTGAKGFEKVFGRKARADEMFFGKTGTTHTGHGIPYSLYVGAFSQKPGVKGYDRALVVITERSETRPAVAEQRNGAAEIAFRLVKSMRGQ